MISLQSEAEVSGRVPPDASSGFTEEEEEGGRRTAESLTAIQMSVRPSGSATGGKLKACTVNTKLSES